MSKIAIQKVELTADERFTLVEVCRATPIPKGASGLAHVAHVTMLEKVLRYDDALDEVHALELAQAKAVRDWQVEATASQSDPKRKVGPRPRPQAPETMQTRTYRLPAAAALFARGAIESMPQQQSGHNALMRLAVKLRCKLTGKGFDFELAEGGKTPDGIEWVDEAELAASVAAEGDAAAAPASPLHAVPLPA